MLSKYVQNIVILNIDLSHDNHDNHVRQVRSDVHSGEPPTSFSRSSLHQAGIRSRLHHRAYLSQDSPQTDARGLKVSGTVDLTVPDTFVPSPPLIPRTRT